ncbi:MAG: Gfo/Idh/MocA family oxidoreductase [Kiritimatiellaeota bacterium]|nr:Gfo/Idh/MocA family oxidoreductase [Kiritimatiellota bacterium]
MAITAGVIGCGNISRFHFSGLEKAGVTVKWVCDLDETAARPWADRFGAAYAPDYREILADPEVDLVDITAFSYKEMCMAAVTAGKAVICEKTLAENAEDAAEIVRRAESAGTIFYTSYMKRFIPAVEKAKALLPRLGCIVSTHIRTHQCWGDLWSEAPDSGPFHTPDGGMSEVRRRYGGGILACGGSHILDLVLYLIGRPRRLYASVAIPADRDYDLQATALLETNHGIVLCEALAHPLRRIGFLRDGWDERVEINGTNGRLEVFSAQWDKVETNASLLVHYDNTTGQATEYRYAPVSPFDRAIAFFCENIARGEQGAQSRRTGYDVDELIETMVRSSQEHKALAVRWRL